MTNTTERLRTDAQPPADENNVLTRTVSNERIKRTYTAFTADGSVHIRVREEDSGTVVLDSMHGFDLADNGETVAHSGKPWEEHALDRFRRLNDARFRHEFTNLRGEI